MPRSERSYLVYIDDSGNEQVGWLWSAIAHPIELWTDHLGRWLSFRSWLYRTYLVPASFELHAQVWLSADPAKNTDAQQLARVTQPGGQLVEIVRKGRASRRARFEVFEKALKTIGSLPDAQLFTTSTPNSSGPAKFDLYDDLLCFLESFFLAEQAHGTLIVDGLHDGGGHLRRAHRALLIRRRRVVEDASHRASADSQLLQMVDLAAYAALQSIQSKPGLDPKFTGAYEKALSCIIARPSGESEGRAIRGLDYAADRANCPSERAITS
jgi:hypothetical protein